MLLPNTKNFSMKKHSGYTLIELMLVVAVIALIAALGVKTYRDKAQSDRINMAALGMQHVLESAMAYNVANKGHWPKENWNSKDCLISNAADDPFVQTYLPNQNYQSNFGTHYCWSGNNQNNEPTAPLFWAAMPVPGSDAPEATDFAKRIAARLPNAIITDNPSAASTGANYCNNNPCYVKAAVAIPSQTSNNNSGFLLVGMGYCMPQDPNNNNYVSDPLLGPHFPPIAGIPGGVQCTQLAGNANGQTDEQRRAQYVVNFACNNESDSPYVYALPSFLTTSRYNPDDYYNVKLGDYSAFIDRLQISRAGNNGTDIWGTFPQANSNCVSVTNSPTQFSCSIVMDASVFHIQGNPLNPSTNTPGYSVTHSGGGYLDQTDKSPQNPGAIGATYMAACVAETSPYAKLTLKHSVRY